MTDEQKKPAEDQGGDAPRESEHARAVRQMIERENALKDTVPAMAESAKAVDPMDEPMLKWFKYCHLPPDLQLISSPFYDLAHEIVRAQRRTPERTVCLRKLLEAKDAAVRNALP